MKKLICTSLLLTIFTIQAQEFKETTDVVEAQVKITKGLIDNIMNDIQTEQADVGFEVDDYYEQVQDFKNEVNEVMINFEDQLQEQVFNPAKKLISEYNNVYNSSAFSQIQKTEILRELKSNIDEKFIDLSSKYKTLVQELYTFGGLNLNEDFYRFEFSKKNDSFTSTDSDYSSKKHEVEVTIQVTPTSPVRKIVLNFNSDMILATSFDKQIKIHQLDGVWVSDHEGYSKAYIRNCKDPMFRKYYCSYEINFEQLFSLVKKNHQTLKLITIVDRYQERVQGKCQTNMCKYLRSADYKKFLINVNSEFDKRINFRLADNEIAAIETKHWRGDRNSITDSFDGIFDVIGSHFTFGQDFVSEYKALKNGESGQDTYDISKDFGKLLYLLTTL